LFTGLKPARNGSHRRRDDAADRARGFPEELIDPNALASQRVRIALQGHAPFAAATQAVYVTLKALRDGELPKNLNGLASSELTGRVTRDADMKTRSAGFLGLKR
jgi:carboxyvinyl-carboxyphosphonate phosphorylmutase